ncbi:MAG: sensor diguanylate cyclase [Frankiales bacterium]|nr:sensor diguanylate cyclase [Frankiales bacterium]
MPTSAHAERLRLAALRAYEVLDSEPSPDLDGLVRLAAYITGAPVAMLNLLDEDRQWQAAVFGGVAREVPRGEAMCGYAVDSRTSVHVADAAADPRWSGNPFVDGRYATTRLYAAVPLLDPDGHALGTLCVLDERTRELSTEQLAALGLLADQVVALFESRRRAVRLGAAVDELDRLAHVDPLTGLVNRAAATRAIERQCVSGGWGLLFLDVDDFKTVNDVAGHQAGDAALREVAARLRSGLRPHDLLARWSGDEFVALLHDVHEGADLQVVTDRLHREVGRPFALDGWEGVLSVSIGGALVPAGGSPEQVLRAADDAMYAAKRLRRATALVDLRAEGAGATG